MQLKQKAYMEQDLKLFLLLHSTETVVLYQNSMVLMQHLFQKLKMIKEEPSQQLSQYLRSIELNLKWWMQFVIKFTDMIQVERILCLVSDSEKYTNISISKWIKETKIQFLASLRTKNRGMFRNNSKFIARIKENNYRPTMIWSRSQNS